VWQKRVLVSWLDSAVQAEGERQMELEAGRTPLASLGASKRWSTPSFERLIALRVGGRDSAEEDFKLRVTVEWSLEREGGLAAGRKVELSGWWNVSLDDAACP